MADLLSNGTELTTPSPADTQLAQESSQRLAKIIGAKKQTAELRIQPEGGEEESISIPVSVLGLFTEILTELGKGNAVTLLPIHAELTTQQAADLLNVSRPFLIELLDKGEIPHQKVGARSHVLLQDLIAYKRKTDQRRLPALEELSALDQELGLGY